MQALPARQIITGDETMKKNNRTALTFLLLTLAVVLAIFMIYLWQERFKETDNKPVIICPTETISVSVESLKDYSILLRDVTAIDVEDGDITSSVVVESVSQFVEYGHCIVTYAAFDSANNVAKLTRHLFLTDYSSPQFVISDPFVFNYSSSFNPLSSIGAIDCVDGNISDRVKMNLLNPDDDVTSVGVHKAEFKVTNSLGDVSVFETEIEVYDRTYTETRFTPVIKLTDYLIYADQFSYIDPMSCVKGIQLAGVLYGLDEYGSGTLTVDDSDVDYSVPGIYRVEYSCDYKGEYFGSTVLVVIVTEVDG